MKLPDFEITEYKTLVEYHGEDVPEVTVPDGVEYIGGHAFYDYRIKSIILPDSLKKIDLSAFFSKYVYPRGATISKISYRGVVFNSYGDTDFYVRDIIDMIANKDYSIKLSHDVKYPIIFQIYFNEKDPVTEAYIKKNLMKIFTFVIDASKYTLPDDEKISIIKNLLETGKFFTSRNIARYINIADQKQKFDIFDMLTEYQENLKTNKI